MIILHVCARVKPGYSETFRIASVANATESRKEPGVLRFDVLQQADDPNAFLLVEAYRTPEDHLRHKETAHYKTWRDAVADLMAEPRSSRTYNPVFCADV